MRAITKAVALGAVVVLAAVGCSDDDDGDTTAEAGAPTTEATASGDTTASDDTMADDMTAGVSMASSTLGDVLALDGLPLYAFDRDTPESSSCVDACTQAWPPVLADAEVAADLEVTIGSILRDDGTEQLTINGSPVYTFTTDDPLPADGSGEPFGQGASDAWWVVGPDGNALREIPAN